MSCISEFHNLRIHNVLFFIVQSFHDYYWLLFFSRHHLKSFDSETQSIKSSYLLSLNQLVRLHVSDRCSATHTHTHTRTNNLKNKANKLSVQEWQVDIPNACDGQYKRNKRLKNIHFIHTHTHTAWFFEIKLIESRQPEPPGPSHRLVRWYENQYMWWSGHKARQPFSHHRAMFVFCPSSSYHRSERTGGGVRRRKRFIRNY